MFSLAPSPRRLLAAAALSVGLLVPASPLTAQFAKDPGPPDEEELAPDEAAFPFDYEVFSLTVRRDSETEFRYTILAQVGNLGTDPGPGARLEFEVDVPEGVTVEMGQAPPGTGPIPTDDYVSLQVPFTLKGLTPERAEELQSLLLVARNTTPDAYPDNDENDADVPLVEIPDDGPAIQLSRADLRIQPAQGGRPGRLVVQVEANGLPEAGLAYRIQIGGYTPVVGMLAERPLEPATPEGVLQGEISWELTPAYCGQTFEGYASVLAIERDPETDTEYVRDGGSRDLKIEVPASACPKTPARAQ